LPATVDSHPVQSKNPFYHVIPEENNVQRVLEYQRRFVDRILSYTLKHDHVLYCMDNEIGGTSKWGAYWAKHVRQVANAAGRHILVSEMFDPHDLAHPLFNEIVEHPETYDYIEIAQNNHQVGQTHYDKIQEMRQRIASHPRPLGNVKIYGRTGPPFGTTKDGVERFWRNIFSGCASARFHEKHLGDSDVALQMIRSARAITGAFDLFHSAPHKNCCWTESPTRLTAWQIRDRNMPFISRVAAGSASMPKVSRAKPRCVGMILTAPIGVMHNDSNVEVRSRSPHQAQANGQRSSVMSRRLVSVSKLTWATQHIGQALNGTGE
jgi:hypothetical protein